MIDNLENEEWKTIENYDNYQVSNFGRVKSLKGKEKILKPSNDKDGYQVIGIYKNGKQKLFKIHRLVANAFIDNPNNLPQVNHIDENPSNNHVDNLEWCNCKYNNNYGTRNERHSITISGENNPMYSKLGKDCPNSKQVIQLTLDGDYIKSWDSVMDIQRTLGYHQGNISSCCRGKQKTSNGFIWQYT